jgi:hypothetical protein
MAELSEIRDILTDRLRQLNTGLPGRVLSYDSSTRKAEVQPLIKEKFADGQILTLPRITGVPVIMPATSGSGFIMPIGDGDPVLLLFMQRSIDRWLASGGVQEAADATMHALSDAVAIPGLFPFTVRHSDGSGVRVFNENGEIRLESGTAASKATIKTQSDGKVALGTQLVELLDEVTKALDATATSICANGAPLSNSAAIQASSNLIKTIKGSI